MAPGNQKSGIERLGALSREWAEMVKIEHTVFALPFALSGLILGSRNWPTWAVVFWTCLAFAGARAAAMTLNRLIDAGVDKLNPRTAERSIPAGHISEAQAVWFAVLSFALMIFAAWHLPPLCLWLSPVAIIWLSIYSYTKRFTWLCHFVLGGALGGAALGGWIAAGGELNQMGPWLLALAVASWVAGFDVIYACQDEGFDRQNKLHSLPSQYGLTRALFVSNACHVVTVACLLATGFCLGLGKTYFVGVCLVAGMLIWEHRLVSPQDLSRVNAAFFSVNGCVSIAAFLMIVLDRMLG